MFCCHGCHLSTIRELPLRVVTSTMRFRQNKKGPRWPFFILFGAPGEIRTPDHQVRSLVLYPAELRAHFLHCRPGGTSLNIVTCTQGTCN